MPGNSLRDATLRDLSLIALSALATGAYLVLNTAILFDGDTAWHVAAGRWILEHRMVPVTDPFSFTARGRPWTTHEWLSEVAMFLAYRGGGWAGLMLLYAGCLAALFVLLGRQLRRWMTPVAALVPLLYCAIGLQPSLLARPHVIGWVLLAGWTTALIRAVDERRTPRPWLAVLLALWANLHASSVFGLLLVGPFALDALVRAAPADRVRTVRGWAVFGVLCVLATMLTPSGVQGLLYPFQVAGMTSIALISEWMPTRFVGITMFEIVLMSGLFFCLWKPVRIPLARLLLLLGLLHMALAHQRHQPVFIIVATLVLAEPFARSYGNATAARFQLRDGLRAHGRELVPVLGVIVALFAGVALFGLFSQTVRRDSYGVPATAISAIPAALYDKPVLNEYSFGGSLILAGIPVYIDGRNDMYGDAHTTDYTTMVNHGDRALWDAARRKWKFAWTILPPDKPLVKLIDADPGWRRIYADDWAVIHVSRAATAGLDLGLGRVSGGRSGSRGPTG